MKYARVYADDVKVEQGGHPETANCGNLTLKFTDTHITVAVGPTTDLTTTLIVEVTPWWRQEMKKQGIDWSTPTLHQTLTGKKVKFTGWLLFDENRNDHRWPQVSRAPVVCRASQVEPAPRGGGKEEGTS